MMGKNVKPVLLQAGTHTVEIVGASKRTERGEDLWLITFRDRRPPNGFAYLRLRLWSPGWAKKARALLDKLHVATGIRPDATQDGPEVFRKSDVEVTVEANANGYTYVTDVNPVYEIPDPTDKEAAW